MAEREADVLRSVTLAHPDPAKTICVFTDASEHFWGAIVTQIPKEDEVNLLSNSLTRCWLC